MWRDEAFYDPEQELLDHGPHFHAFLSLYIELVVSRLSFPSLFSVPDRIVREGQISEYQAQKVWPIPIVCMGDLHRRNYP